MTKRFHVNLSNPSFGVIEKGKGIVTILEDDSPPPVDPPEPQPENNFIWECIYENLSGANITSVSHSCEEGYEYMCAHIDYEGDNELVWSHVAIFPNDRTSGTWSGQAMDTGINFGKTQIMVDLQQHTTRIIKVIRRPLPIAADEDSRVNGNEFVKVGSGKYHQWDLGYEYYITTYEDVQNFTATIVTDPVIYNAHTKIDRWHAFIASVQSNKDRWIGFEHDKENKADKTKRKLRSHRCSIGNIWRRPIATATGTPDEFKNEWKRVKNFSYSAPGTTTFNWQDNKEYLVILDDRDGNWELASTKVLTFPGLLNVPGVDRHKAGIAASAGGHCWTEFMQTSVGGSKQVKARWGGRLMSILERDLYLDGVSCLGEAPDDGSPSKLTFNSDTPGITKYLTETFDQSPCTAEAYVGTNRGNDTPDLYNDKYGETVKGIVIPINHSSSGREVTPSNAYKGESIDKTSDGWYLSVIDETVHTSSIKYVKVKNVAVGLWANTGHKLTIIPTNNQGDGFEIDHQLKVRDLYNDSSASIQDVYDMTVNGLHIQVKDSEGNNINGITVEFTITLEFEFNDGTKYPHTLILGAYSGGY